MPTAIFRDYTPEGLVIAADGRMANFTTRKVISDRKEKIFQIRDRPWAYCMTGVVLLGDEREDRTDTILFDIEAQLKGRIQATAPGKNVLLRDYAKKLFRPIHQDLRDACQQFEHIDPPVGLGSNQYGYRILTIFFDGYDKDIPPASR